MERYIISLYSETSEYVDLEKELSDIGVVIPVAINIYLVLTNATAVYIRDCIKAIDSSLTIFVSACSKPAAWRNIITDSERIKGYYND